MMVWVLLIAVAPCVAEGGDAVVPDRGPPTIPDTQITLATRQAQFQATVIGKEERSLTLLTSAHCLAPEDVGKAIGISWRGEGFRGRIVSVARNPYYQPILSRNRFDRSVRNIVGVDNAIVTLVVEPPSAGAERVLQKIRTAEMTPRRVLGGSRQIVSVHIVDQFGQEHVVRAGNHLNPKCLAWGQGSYAVRPGDSGAGVFLLLKAIDGSMWPLLIGNVSLNDSRGGIAPLVFRRDPWVEDALTDRRSDASALGSSSPVPQGL